MALSFDHLGIITRSAQENADMAAFFAQVLDLLVEGDAADGYAEVHAGAMTIALHHGAMIDDIAALGANAGDRRRLPWQLHDVVNLGVRDPRTRRERVRCCGPS